MVIRVEINPNRNVNIQFHTINGVVFSSTQRQQNVDVDYNKTNVVVRLALEITT